MWSHVNSQSQFKGSNQKLVLEVILLGANETLVVFSISSGRSNAHRSKCAFMKKAFTVHIGTTCDPISIRIMEE